MSQPIAPQLAVASRQRRPLIKQRLVAAASVVNLSEHCRPTGRDRRAQSVCKNQPSMEIQTGCVLRLYMWLNGRLGHISFNRCFFRVLGDPVWPTLSCAAWEWISEVVVTGASEREREREYNDDDLLPKLILNTWAEQNSVNWSPVCWRI